MIISFFTNILSCYTCWLTHFIPTAQFLLSWYKRSISNNTCGCKYQFSSSFYSTSKYIVRMLNCSWTSPICIWIRKLFWSLVNQWTTDRICFYFKWQQYQPFSQYYFKLCIIRKYHQKFKREAQYPWTMWKNRGWDRRRFKHTSTNTSIATSIRHYG